MRVQSLTASLTLHCAYNPLPCVTATATADEILDMDAVSGPSHTPPSLLALALSISYHK